MKQMLKILSPYEVALIHKREIKKIRDKIIDSMVEKTMKTFKVTDKEPGAIDMEFTIYV